jgi:hypothetical protein
VAVLIRPFQRGETFRRVIASSGIALVLLLAALSASPNLHRAFHADDAIAADDGCAVVQFAQGISSAPDPLLAAAATVVFHLERIPAAAEKFLASPRYLHQPERGPPVS